MKKILNLFLVLGLCFSLVGCSGSDDSNKESDKESTTEEKKEDETTAKSDYDLVSEKLTLETNTADDGTVFAVAKDGDTKKFSMYKSITDENKDFAAALGISVGSTIYHVNGDDSETYLVDSDTVFVTATDATAESMKNSMDSYLKEKGLTFDQIKNALNDVE